MTSTPDKPVVVTGATGFVATHLIKKLLDTGHTVRATARNMNTNKRVALLKEYFSGYGDALEIVEADLLDKKSWIPVMEGIEYVYHIGSPTTPDGTDEQLIKPALDGTLNVLKACKKSRTVKRVVITSSIIAVMDKAKAKHRVFDESDWAPLKENNSYGRSKVLAEKAAWEYVDKLKERKKFEIATIQPGVILGEMLYKGGSSPFAEGLEHLLERKYPMVPRVHLPCVSVETVVEAHMKAMVTPQAAGHRHIIVEDGYWAKDVAAMLREEFYPMGYNVPTTELPYWVLRLAAVFDRLAKYALPAAGVEFRFDTTRMRTVLDIEPKNMKNVFVDMAYNHLDKDALRKTNKYRSKNVHTVM